MENVSNCPFSNVQNINLPFDQLNGIYSSGFNIKINDETFLYGLLEGYGNVNSSSFFKDKFVSNICTNLKSKNTEIEIKNLLYQTFLLIENSILDSNLSNNDLRNSGITAIIILLIKNRIFVANTGSNIALLCQVDSEHIHHIDKLSIEHSLDNTEELGRISSCGIDLNKLITLAKEICPLNSLRIIGDYDLKKNYKNHALLSKLTSSPWSASPHLTGPIIFDEAAQVLILASASLFQHLKTDDRPDINKYLCSKILESLGQRKDLADSMNILVKDILYDLKRTDSVKTTTKSSCILVRCLNVDLIGKFSIETDKFVNLNNPTIRPKALSIEIPANVPLSNTFNNWRPYYPKLTIESDTTLSTKTTSEETTHSTSTDESNSFRNVSSKLDENGLIEAYVSFHEFNRFVVEELNNCTIDDNSVNEIFFNL